MAPKRQKKRKVRSAGPVQVDLAFPSHLNHTQAAFIQEVAAKSLLPPASVLKLIGGLKTVVAGRLKEKGRCHVDKICELTVKTMPAQERRPATLWGKKLYLKERPAGQKICVRVLPALRRSLL